MGQIAEHRVAMRVCVCARTLEALARKLVGNKCQNEERQTRLADGGNKQAARLRK